MGKFDVTEEPSGGKSIDHPYDHCACGDEGAINLINVRRGSTQKRGAFSQFGYTKNGKLYLNGGYEFVSWHTMCADCFYGKKPLVLVSEFSENQLRKVWMTFIAIMTKGTRLAMWQNNPRTPESDKRAIEIANQEALRLDIPDAIPDEFKLVSTP